MNEPKTLRFQQSLEIPTWIRACPWNVQSSGQCQFSKFAWGKEERGRGKKKSKFALGAAVLLCLPFLLHFLFLCFLSLSRSSLVESQTHSPETSSGHRKLGFSLCLFQWEMDMPNFKNFHLMASVRQIKNWGVVHCSLEIPLMGLKLQST